MNASTDGSALRELYLLGDPLRPAALTALAQSRVPGLERLVLSLRSEVAGLWTEQDVASLIRVLRVRDVHVGGLDQLATFIAALTSAGPPTELTTLTLADGTSTDEDALLDAVRKHAKALRSLRTLGLPFAALFSSGAEGAAHALLPAACDSAARPRRTFSRCLRSRELLLEQVKPWLVANSPPRYPACLDETALLEKLARIEALFFGATTDCVTSIIPF